MGYPEVVFQPRGVRLASSTPRDGKGAVWQIRGRARRQPRVDIDRRGAAGSAQRRLKMREQGSREELK